MDGDPSNIPDFKNLRLVTGKVTKIYSEVQLSHGERVCLYEQMRAGQLDVHARIKDVAEKSATTEKRVWAAMKRAWKIQREIDRH